MALPSSYTEATFKAFLHKELRGLAAVLGWTVGGDNYNAAVDRTLELYGTDDVSNASDIKKLRAVGRVALWESVVIEVALNYDFAADGANVSRSQMHEQASKQLERARIDAAEYLDELLVTAVSRTWKADPYA